MDFTMFARALAALNLRRKKLNENEKGFTLIELLVVVIIIGILAAIAIPVYLGIQANAKDSAVKSDLTNAKTAVIAYQTDNGGFPDDLTTGQKFQAVATELGKYGYTQGTNTNDLQYSVTPTATTFCIVADAASDDSKRFYVTDSSGVVGPTTTKPLGC